MKLPADLVEQIKSLMSPSVIAVSGFGGSGKTTLADLIGESINAPVVGVDSFQKDGVFDTAYKLWEIMDFVRLEKEVFIPFFDNQEVISYGNFDPVSKSITKRQIENTGKLVVEGVGLFRPELEKYLMFKIWIDCPIQVALERGKKRDREIGSPVDSLWEGLWKENDLQYLEKFDPKSNADFVVNNS